MPNPVSKSDERTSSLDARTAASLEIEALEDRLSRPRLIPDRKLAAALRDRAAGLLLADASQAMRIARALRGAVDRHATVVDPATRAIASRSFAEASLYTGNLNRARLAYEEASRFARVAGDAGLLGQILVGQVGTLTLMGNHAGTARLAAEAGRLLERAGDLSYLARLYMNLGSAHYHAERYKEAYRDYAKASRFAEQAGDRSATWVGLRLNQGIACTQLFRLDEARRLFLETEQRARRLGLERLEAQARFNRASLEALRGNFREALAELEKAGDIFERQGVIDMQAAVRLSRAEMHLDLAMPAEALDLAHLAAQGFRAAGMELDSHLAELARARSLLLAGRPDAALPILEAAVAFYGRRRIRPRRAEAQISLARAWLALGNHAMARRRARQAARAFRAVGLLQAEVRALCLEAEALLEANAAARAERVLARVMTRSRSLQIGVQFELWLLAGRVARRLGRRSESLVRLRRAVRCLEDQRRLIPGPDLRAHLFDSQVVAYHALIKVLIEAGRPGAAALLPLLEAARGRAFRERRQRRAEPIPGAILEKRTLLGSLSRRLESLDFGDAAPHDTREGERLRQSILALEKTIAREVRRWEAQRGQAARHTLQPGPSASRGESARPGPGGQRGHGARSTGSQRGHPQDGSPPSAHRLVSALQGKLGSDEAVLDYFVAEEAIIAVVVRREAAAVRVLPAAAKQVRAAVESLRFQIDLMAATTGQPVGSDEIHLQSAQSDLITLYRFLVGPVRDLLPDQGRLRVIPHRFLHLVPFACLHDGDDYVDTRWIVTRSPTADHLAHHRPRRVAAAGRAARGCAPGRGTRPWSPQAVIAGMVEGGPVSVRSEMAAVAASLPAGRRRLLQDPSPEELMTAIASAELVHISTHGFFREDNPIFSRLSLRGGALFLADVLNLRLRAEVVVLSACNSGQVFSGMGDDLSGVAHGFLAAGARQLVASLWRIHDEATAEWMSAFYQALTHEAGGDAGLALNQAGRSLRRRRPHPFYWGAFSAHGV